MNATAPAGALLGAVLLVAAAGSPGATYAGAAPALLGLEVAGSVAMLAAAALAPAGRARGTSALLAAAWPVPDLAGWAVLPEALRTACDAWSRLVPGLLLLVVLADDGPASAAPRRRRWWPAAVVLVGGVPALARLVLVDPFLDPDCWRTCDHNPLVVPAGLPGSVDLARRLDAAAAVLAALLVAGVLAAAGRRASAPRVAVSVLTLAAAAPAVLRLTGPESATRTPSVVAFVIIQLGAVAFGAALVRERLALWRLRTRLGRLAGLLLTAPAPGGLAGALRIAVGDPRLQLRYWAPARGAFVDGDGRPQPRSGDEVAGGLRVTAVARRGRQVAEIVHGGEVDGGRLERALGPAFRLALENEQLRAATLAELHELRASRARIVERAHEERRRLERNLHDGAQQRVVALALMVRMLAGSAGGGTDLVAEAERLTVLTVDELRRVARGIHPAVLADTGLCGALTDLAESSRDLAIGLDRPPAGRYTGTVETTIYRVVTVATDDARRRGATSATVRGTDRGVLRFEVEDDGPPGDHRDVLGLGDQVRALGGRLTVGREGPRTLVRVELPCVSS